MSCEDKYSKPCPTNNECKSEWELTKTKDNCFIDGVVEESIDIGGADINVFKLLGVHEQHLLVDQTGNGNPLDSGSPASFPAINAYTDNTLEWRSQLKGSNVVASAYLGYDFGIIRLDNSRARYGVDTSIRKHITTIIIKQGANAANRVTKARIERSENGTDWFGAAIIELPDDSNEHQISFKRSVPSRYWRIRPLEFGGGAADSWNVERLQLIHYVDTALQNLEDDYIFLENRNRDYAEDSIPMKGSYDLIDTQTELTRFGIDLPSQQLYMQMSFSSCVKQLGRPVVVGDIFELPSETQWNANMEPVKKYMEVTDVGWSTEGYTPGWQPTLLRVVIMPALAKQETMDVFGDFVPNVGDDGFLDIDTDKYTDLQEVSERAEAQAKENLPERGADIADVAEIDQETIDANLHATGTDLSNLNINPNSLYVEDALPPNGEDFSEGDEFPATPSEGDYHRMTYSGLAEDIPPRLYRWSISKNRWIYLETDKRFEYNKTKPTLQEFLSNGVPLNKVEK